MRSVKLVKNGRKKKKYEIKKCINNQSKRVIQN